MTESASLVDRLWQALREVEDPELPISIVDLGLVVDLGCDSGAVWVKLTFTAMGCPATEMLMDDVRARLEREPGVESVSIDVVWEPIWSKARLSEEGKAQLREVGISV